MRIVFLLFLAFTTLTAIAQQPIDPYHYATTKNITVSKAAVVSAHPLASAAGLWVLQKGGNAIDAAIATQLALAVVYPAAGNIGGGGFLVARLANGKNVAIDYREKAPGKGSRDMYLDEKGNAINNLSKNGHLASGVPGTVAGLITSHKYGKLPFATLVEPAILLAKGHAIDSDEARSLNAHHGAFILNNTKVPVFVKGDQWKAGDTLAQPDLVKTLERIRDQGWKGFYEGETARLIVEEMARGKGLISLEDLRSYQATEREAVVFPYKNYEIVTMALPSSGGVLLPQMMNMVRNRELGKKGHNTPDAIQLMVEVERRAYADRSQFLGDPDFVKVPIKTLTSQSYADKRMEDYKPGVAGNSNNINFGEIRESDQTTHLSVVDQYGNAVSVTTTLNGGYGSHTVVAGAGFILNNEMDDFSVKPGVPNMYGALGGEANAIAPNKRMLSSMTPSIVLKNKKPYIVVGTPGGTTITTNVFLSIINILEFNLSAVDAVNMPKFHHQWKPDEILVERDMPQATVDALQKMGYKIRKTGAIGRTELILINGKKIEAVADKRGADAAAGF
ncbi:MAG: gamma-glutamyltransferase [Chitinophagaceae bacterium]